MEASSPLLPSPSATSIANSTWIGNITMPDGTKKGVYIVLLDENHDPMNLPSDQTLKPETLKACTKIFQEIINSNKQSPKAVKKVTAGGFSYGANEVKSFNRDTISKWTEFLSTLLEDRSSDCTVSAELDESIPNLEDD